MKMICFLLFILFLTVWAGNADNKECDKLDCEMGRESRSDFSSYGQEENPVPVKYYKRNYVNINMEVYILEESECYSHHTEAAFTVYVATLSRASTIIGIAVFRSEEFYYDPEEKSYHLMSNRPSEGLKKCLNSRREDCIPRGDVIFIDYKGSGDKMAIRSIEVNAYVALGPKDKHHHKIESYHSLMMPCQNAIRQRGYYQIGPVHGLFMKMKRDFKPVVGARVKDFA